MPEAFANFDYTTAFNDLLNAPSTILNAFLSGTPAVPAVTGPLSFPAIPATDGVLTGAATSPWTTLTTALTNELSPPTYPFPVVDWTDFSTNTTANLATSGLTDLFSSAGSPLLYNPAALVAEFGMLLSIAGGSGFPAIGHAVAGLSEDIHQALANLDYTTAFNDLLNVPSTILNAFLNGNPAVPAVTGSSSFPAIPAELGLLTSSSPLLSMLAQTVTDEVAAADGTGTMTGTLPEVTGSLTLSANLSQLFSDLGIPLTDGTLTINNILTDLGIGGGITIGDVLDALGLSFLTSSGDLDITVGDFDNALVSLLGNVADATTNALSALNTLLGLTPDETLLTIPGISLGDILEDFGLNTGTVIFPGIDTILDDLGLGSDLDVNLLGWLHLSATTDLLNIPSLDITGASIPTYVDDWAKDLVALLGPKFDSTLTLDLGSLLSGAETASNPIVSAGGDVSVNLTNILAELLNDFLATPTP